MNFGFSTTATLLIIIDVKIKIESPPSGAKMRISAGYLYYFHPGTFGRDMTVVIEIFLHFNNTPSPLNFFIPLSEWSEVCHGIIKIGFYLNLQSSILNL